MPASWNMPPTPPPHATPAAPQDQAAPGVELAVHEAALQQLHDRQAEQQQQVQKLEADVARSAAFLCSCAIYRSDVQSLLLWLMTVYCPTQQTSLLLLLL